MSYDNSANAVRRLEERFERLLLIIGDMQAAIGRLQQPALNPAGSQQTSSGITPLYFATNSASLGPATGTTLAGITPATFTSSVYTNVGGVMTLQAASQTCYWWYLDTALANSIIAVEPNAAGTGWDCIATGCTVL